MVSLNNHFAQIFNIIAWFEFWINFLELGILFVLKLLFFGWTKLVSFLYANQPRYSIPNLYQILEASWQKLSLILLNKHCLIAALIKLPSCFALLITYVLIVMKNSHIGGCFSLLSMGEWNDYLMQFDKSLMLLFSHKKLKQINAFSHYAYRYLHNLTKNFSSFENANFHQPLWSKNASYWFFLQNS